MWHGHVASFLWRVHHLATTSYTPWIMLLFRNIQNDIFALKCVEMMRELFENRKNPISIMDFDSANFLGDHNTIIRKCIQSKVGKFILLGLSAT